MVIFNKFSNFYLYFALVGYSLFIAIPSSPLFAGAGYDREIFKYVGMVINNGGNPYRDVFDHKPPLIYLIAALSNIFGVWGFWLFERVITGITAIGFLIWLKNSKFKASALLSFIVAPCHSLLFYQVY
jgi:hypothetical protein